MLEQLNNHQTQTEPRIRGYGCGYNGDGHGCGNIDGYGVSTSYPLDAVDLLTRLAAQHVVKPTGETR